MANCRSYAKILVALLVIAIGVVIWFVFQALTEKMMRKFRMLKARKLKLKAENSPLDTKKDEVKAEEPKKKNRKEEPKKEEQPAQQTGQQEIKVIGTTGKESTLEIHNNKTLELEITTKGASYVGIKNEAGNDIFSGTIEEGQTQKYDLSTAKVVNLNIGSAPNVEFKLNGQVVTFPLNPEENYHQKFLIKNLGIEQPAQ